MATGIVADTEIRELEEFPGYGVDRRGGVWTRRCSNGRLLKQWKRKAVRSNIDGYLVASFWVNGRTRTVRVHRLLLAAFVGPCPPGMQACHADGDVTNNALDNLRWDTQAGNWSDRREHGTASVGSNHYRARLTESDVKEIRRMAMVGVPHLDLAARFMVSRRSINAIVNRQNWRHI